MAKILCRPLRLLATIGLQLALLAQVLDAQAQGRRSKSPAGSAATQVGGTHFDPVAGWVGGFWIEMEFGRPIRRGRQIFAPVDFIDALYDGAEVWRAGANWTTRLRTEGTLEIAGRRVPPGQYTVFIELGKEHWTFILSSWPAQEVYDEQNAEALFGAYGYTSDRDVVRTTMLLEELPRSFDQLSWQFLDMEPTGGRIALVWEGVLASVPFRVVEAEELH